MNKNTFFFDTYAIMEIIKGNNKFEQFLDDEIIINNFVYAELCYNLIRENHENRKNLLGKYAQHISSVKPEWIEEAMEFRLKWKDRKVSMADCTGYIMAKQLGIKFLTGDKEFEKLENVEFVRK